MCGGRQFAATGSARGIKRWTVALTLLLLATLWKQFGNIGGTVPYPQHVDEPFVSGPAHTTLITGTLHPRVFNYPSLPKYLASFGMAIGFLNGASHGEIADTQRLGTFGFPYYDHPRLMQTARRLFALLSAMAVAATGLIAWVVIRRPAAILFAPLLLVVSPLYFSDSWLYLNVDIIATCFATLAIAGALWATDRPSLAHSALLPGALAGLATGGKYTLAVVIAPVILGILFYMPRGQRVAGVLAAFASMIAAFLVAVPYSLIDIPGFLNGLASEAFHYASGHRGFQDDPGWPQLRYYARHFASEFGVSAPLAVVGLAVLAVRDWRRTVILTSHAVALLWLLAGQRVHFTRNVLSLHPILAVYAAAGTGAVYDWLLAAAVGRGWTRPGAAGGVAGWAAASILAMAVVPLWHVAENLKDRTDSRNLAQAWVERNVPVEWSIVIPAELAFDSRTLEAAGRRIIKVSFGKARDSSSLLNAIGVVPGPAVVLVPHFGADARFPSGDVAVVLNQLTEHWRVMANFGSNPVLVNYSYPNPSGNPAFAVAVFDQSAAGTDGGSHQ